MRVSPFLYLALGFGWLCAPAVAQCRQVEAPAPSPAGAGRGATAPAAPAAPIPLQATAGAVQVTAVLRDHLQLAVPLTITSTRNGTIRRVEVRELTVNGLPLYAAPIATRLQLTAGQSVALPEPLSVSVYYRDLDSLTPLLTVLKDGHARVEGTLIASVQLGLAARLLLATGQVMVPVSFRSDVPVAVPGGIAGRAAAVAGLTAAEAVLTHAENGAGSLLTLASARRKQLRDAYTPALLAVRTTFALRDRNGPVAAFECAGAGFRVSAVQIVLLKSQVEPWKFDAEIAAAMDSRHLALDPAVYDVILTGVAAGASYSLHGGQVRIALAPKDEAPQVFVPQADGKTARTHAGAQDSAANLVRMEIVGPPPAVPAVQLDAAAPPAAWDSLALFRVAAAAPLHADLLFTAARLEGGSIVLATPVDASAWGSPLIGPNGIVGIVQSETRALPLAALRRALGF